MRILLFLSAQTNIRHKAADLLMKKNKRQLAVGAERLFAAADKKLKVSFNHKGR